MQQTAEDYAPIRCVRANLVSAGVGALARPHRAILCDGFQQIPKESLGQSPIEIESTSIMIDSSHQPRFWSRSEAPGRVGFVRTA
jgi:hypothetical protein